MGFLVFAVTDQHSCPSGFHCTQTLQYISGKLQKHLDTIDFLESCQSHFQPGKGNAIVLKALLYIRCASCI